MTRAQHHAQPRLTEPALRISTDAARQAAARRRVHRNGAAMKLAVAVGHIIYDDDERLPQL